MRSNSGNKTNQQIRNVFVSPFVLRSVSRAGARFGETEAGFCLRFGLSADRIVGSETEEGGPPPEPCGAQFSCIFFLGNTTYSREGYQGQKKCF
jgi:hypothetical protein